MNIIEELETIYSDLNKSIDSIEVALELNKEKSSEVIEKKKKLNDMSYFLFTFTRLEDRIRELSDNLIVGKVATLHDWQIRAAWEIIQKQSGNDSLHFMNRVALLTKKGETDYNLIKQFYDQRNIIGHGGDFTINLNIPFVFAVMIRLYNQFVTTNEPLPNNR